MKRFLLFIILSLSVTVCGFSQNRYLPLGVNGTSAALSIGLKEGYVYDVYLDAGYSIGGRIGLGLHGGVAFEEIGGIKEVVPNVSFNFDVVMLKQRRAVPFSLKAAVRVGFSSALPDQRSIFGTNFGFNMQLAHDFYIKEKLFIGISGLFDYDRNRYTVTNYSADPATEDEYRLHNIEFGPSLDIGFKYHEDDMVILRTDLLWDQDFVVICRIGLLIVVPTTK